MKPSVSSLYQAVALQQQIPPLLIGERANSNGSKKFRELLLADDFDSCLKIVQEQEEKGAHVIDLCTAYAGRDELADLTTLVKLCVSTVKAPLVIDSTTPEVIEACLKLCPGRSIINSINLEDGGVTIRRVCRVAKRYGAAVVALTIDKQGMAMKAEDKLRVAKDIYAVAVGEFGLRPWDILFDCLTFTVGSGDENLRDAAIQTMEGIRLIKKELPGCFTVLGLSNISFGLTPKARRVLNSVFLAQAVEAGLDAAIVDAAKILPLAQIPAEARDVCMDLLYDRAGDQEKTPLMRFIEFFDENTIEEDSKDIKQVVAEKELFDLVVKGRKDEVEDVLAVLMERFAPLDIINHILVPAMRHVGELFGKGEILLPFVLQSAEVMKKSVSYLEPFMEKQEEGAATKILLATVQGDVHDIGKNLVDIILSNNGYTVHNIGIKIPTETIIKKAKELGAHLIGLSGLLVKSAVVMQESMAQFREAGLNIPILLGGAALTPKFVAQDCVPGYGGQVVYCADAFAGLKAVREYEEGTLRSTVYQGEKAGKQKKRIIREMSIERDNTVPEPFFLGHKCVEDIDAHQLLPYVNKQALFRGRWGYRRVKMKAEEYQAMIQETVEPLYQHLLGCCFQEKLLQPRVSYGYFPCHSEGETLVVDVPERYRFTFPRQQQPPHQCIADFFKTDKEGGDIAGFFVVTIGERIGQKTMKLYESGEYHDYLMLHGLSVELTDALAEYWHGVMREELGYGDPKAGKNGACLLKNVRGARYGFGYPACPDLELQRPLFDLLQPEKIGICLTENMQMVPEQTTSAIVVHHPQARYFAV
ncbi:MAG: 5-methyltetrahydrofolate--homocysteine methyltransferase [Deltaproteobacteria bacterium]|nr:MAG: 5-methyltetrahydrofolate--homocysteine methyltransferase [Deltaproteobacteria bacterium]